MWRILSSGSLSGSFSSEISSDPSSDTEATTPNSCDEQDDILPTCGGHDYNFVSAIPHRLICKICFLPGKDPYMSECCGHLFCKSCLNNVRRAAAMCPATSKACPLCCNKEFKTFRNKADDRDIRELHIYCTNKEKGCEWMGELNDINNHLRNSKGCQFEELKCSNECGKMIERQDLTSHVETECPRRMVKCLYCHDTGEHQFIEGQHKEECPKLPLPCPNNCKINSVPCLIRREHMEAHREECPLEMIQCEYHNVGCKERIRRKDQQKHENEEMRKHLMMTKHSLNELNDTQHQLVGTILNSKDQLADALKHLTNLTVLINVQLSPNNNPMTPTTIRSIHLESMAAVFKFDDQTCPVTIKMPEYDIKKKDKAEWFSDSFYTHNKGYRVCLCVHAAGHKDGEGTHLSVYLHIMKGSHDNELAWPMKRNFVIKILNQISDTYHYAMNIINDDSITINRFTEGIKSIECLGSSKFISNEDLHAKYLKDDRLFFQVTSY